jgi:2-methylisocitrate lyase-like PEP mutase family enzyme
MLSQQEKGKQFRALHSLNGCFVIPNLNPNRWDVGSAKILENMGFEALASTSAGLAFSHGRSDGRGLVSREEALTNVEAIVAATNLPVSADLENSFHDEHAGAFETIQLAGQAGGTFCTDSESGELSPWPPGPKRHHSSIAGLSGGGGRCLVRARSANSRGY